MITIRRTFTRRNGETLTVEVKVDMEKLAENMAQTIAGTGLSRATKAGGSIVATVVDDKA